MLGIGLALVARILLLLTVSWIIGLQKPLFTINDFSLSVRDLILIAGGLFLIGKSVSEIHAKLEGSEEQKDVKVLTLRGAVMQIILIDLVFSFDSILTAIGLVEDVIIIIIAIVISLVVMLTFAKKISDFIQKHPAMKILAVSFLIMIGTLLVLEGLHFHVPRGYIYFSIGIELLNMKIRKKTMRVQVDDAREKEEVPIKSR
jgi:predicted tellurium resistance membrane protein TerC